MQREQGSIFRRMGLLLRQRYDNIAQVPLPTRWMDLIKYLNEKEEATLSAPPSACTKKR